MENASSRASPPPCEASPILAPPPSAKAPAPRGEGRRPAPARAGPAPTGRPLSAAVVVGWWNVGMLQGWSVSASAPETVYV